MSSEISLITLQELAARVGLTVLAVTDASHLEADEGFLRQWQHGGYAGELGYMQRDPQLLSSPRQILPEARSVVVVGAPYDALPARSLGPDEGRVARYAWGRDYHKVLRKRLRALVDAVSDHVGRPLVHRLFSDSVPLLERGLAARAGLGFIGKNTMLIVPKLGSFLFLSEVLWELEVVGLPSQSQSAPVASCGSCTRCLDHCPTGAFVGERVLDARRCISYLTIEKRGVLTWQEREWLGEWVFGCDICQEVCPHNFVSLKRRRKSTLPELSADAGVGEALSLSRVLALRTETHFQHAFAGTALMRTKREGLLRNASVVAANKHATHVLPVLHEVALHDSSPVVRRHALWAYVTITTRESTEAQRRVAERLLLHSRQDTDDGVREEATTLLSLLPNRA